MIKTALQIALIALVLILLTGGCGSRIDPAAREQLRATLGSTSVTVYPAFVRADERRYDADAAKAIAEFIEREQLATVALSDEKVDIPGEWSMNQSKMAGESIEAFKAHLLAHPIGTEFALLPEYLMGRDRAGKESAGGIHAYLLTKDGRMAEGVGLNSHHKVFASRKPKTVEDCTDVLISVLRDELKTLREKKADATAPQTAD